MKYAAARHEIKTGDVIAFRGRGLIAAAIRWFSRGSYTHVGLAVWVESRLMLLESREFKGVRLVMLRREIEGADVAWFRPNNFVTFDVMAGIRDIAWALENAGTGYNYLGILRYAYRVVPKWLRWVLPSAQTDDLSYGNRFCSEFVSAHYRNAGVDLRPDLVDSETSPAELCASAALRFEADLEA